MPQDNLVAFVVIYLIMKKVMGLDVSSTTIGICILSYNDKTIKLDYINYYKPPKTGNIFERLNKTRKYIKTLIGALKPDNVAIEDIVLFMSGRSTAKTITTLAILNRVVGLVVLDELKKEPYLYNALRIRHAIKSGKDLPAKEDIPELVADLLKIKFPYEKDKNLKNKKENEDMADAIACAICHIYMDRLGKADALQIKVKKKRAKKRAKKKAING